MMNGNPSRVIIKQLYGRIRRWCYNLIPAESRFKTSCSIIKDTFKMKAQKGFEFSYFVNTGGNGVDVVVPVESIRAISERFVNTACCLFLGKRVAYLIVANYWNPDVNLLKKDVGNVSVLVKLLGVPVTTFGEDGLSVIATKIGTPLMLDSYTSDMCLQSWGRRACCKVFGHVHEECPKNPGLGVAKNLKKHSQAPRGVPAGSNVGFIPPKQAYRLVFTNPTANTSGNKMNDVEPTKKVSNSDPFEFKKLTIDEKITLVDDEGAPMKNVEYPGDHDSEDEVASTNTDMARSMVSEKVGFCTNSLLEQGRDTYENEDYDYDLYDDDMYEGQEISNKIQAICDNLDVKVRGRKKK
nr:hypothetical protein [Tanacetum cinerariifolium]